MDKFQAIFEILYFLAGVDGRVDQREVDVINNFLDANYGKIYFNPGSVVNSISKLSGKGMIDELVSAAIIFKNSSNAQDRITVLDFALQLVAADGIITTGESELFITLGNTWDIDMPRYLASKGIMRR